MRRNVLATSGRAVEAAGDVDVLLLDKTGTITLGNRMATEFIPAPGVTVQDLADAAQLSSLADETPEGRSIVTLAKENYGLRGRDVADPHVSFVPFSAQTRMSGVDFGDAEAAKGRGIRKGAAEAVYAYAAKLGGSIDKTVQAKVEEISRQGATPLVVADGRKILGVICLKDVVKGGIKERFAQLRKMGIKTIMVTGDNQLTAAAIAAEAGVDDFIAQAKPEDKLARIRQEQEGGKLIAMIGDGTNDAPALAQADVGVAMNTGTQAAREAGNMVDLDSNPTKLIEVVEIGKQLLMTRGALTTFSIANDVSKYFAILPAMFGVLYADDPRGFGPSGSVQHHVPAFAPKRILSGHLQCPGYRRLDPPGLEGRQIPAPRGGHDPAQEHAAVWRGRDPHPLRLHQADRHDSRAAPPRLLSRLNLFQPSVSAITMKLTFQSIRQLIVWTVITGMLYPLVMTVVAQEIWPWSRQANGSIVERNGKIVGSELIAQQFQGPTYFWPRPSAVTYATVPSGASNLGPTSAALQTNVNNFTKALREAHKLPADAPVPSDLVFTSASGVDPHISPEAARFQINRVAAARGLSPDQVAALVEKFVEPEQWGFLGEPRVNVLLLNLALDQADPARPPRRPIDGKDPDSG